MSFRTGSGHPVSASGKHQSKPPQSTFPQSIEVIPGKLRVKVFLHDVTYESETIPCWSYLTDGLLSQHQKEILFTLQRANNRKPEDYPRGFFELFATIFHLAEQGQTVDVSDVTRFNEAGFLGDEEFLGLGYIEPQGLYGVDTGNVPLLAAIILKGDEAQIAWEQGLTRITAMLGMKYRYYPCPAWSDLNRKPVISLSETEKSLLLQVARATIPASFYEEQNQIHLTIPPAAKTKLQEFLKMVPPTAALAFRTSPDSRANACLVWRPGQSQPAAITPPGSDGSRKTGAFLGFVPEQNANEVRGMEDGFFFLVNNKDWQKIREALQSGNNLLLPAASAGGASLSIQWQMPQSYTSSATHETYHADKWNTYEPQGNSPPAKERASLRVLRVVLLTSERDLAARTTAGDLAAYTERIEDAADAFFLSQKEKIHRELTIHLDIAEKSHHLVFAAIPPLDEEQHASLDDRLIQVPAPRVLGPVKLDLILSIWQPTNVQ